MYTPSEEEVKEIEAEIEESVLLYSFDIYLTPDKNFIVCPESSEAVDAVREEYGKEYEAVEQTFIKDIDDSILLYGNSVKLIRQGDKRIWDVIPKEIRAALEE